jgi:Fic family protein
MNLPEKFAKIDALKTEVEKLRPINPEQEMRVFQKFRLDWNFNSNAIEGNKLTQGETEMFLLHGLTSKGKPFKDYLDIRGHNEAIDFLLSLVRQQEVLTEAVIRHLHTILLVEPYTVPAITPDGQPSTKTVNLGEYKTLPNHVLTQTGEIHRYASPEETPALMGDLIKWLRDSDTWRDLHPVAVAAIFHHRFTAIHPFDDGNGRLARLLLNLILMQRGFPPVIVRVKNRDSYIFALRKADLGDPEEIIGAVADETMNSLELFLRGARGDTIDELDDIDKEVALLKQKLRHIDDPLVLSLEVQREWFRECIFPLLEKLINKLGQFNEFYFESKLTASLTIATSSKSTTGWNSPANAAPEAILKDIIRHSEKNILLQIELVFNWSRFKKTPLKVLNDSLVVILQFDSLKFTLRAEQQSIERVYQQQLSKDEILDFVARLCKGRVTAVEKHAGLKPV